jgi:hypothetical protein
MNDRAKPLNFCIWAYIAIDIFGYSKIVTMAPSLKVLFVLAPISLLAWEMVLLQGRLAKGVNAASEQPFYERFESGDWLRMFWILCFGHRPMATDYQLGFIVFSGIVTALLCILAFTVSVEWFRKKRTTTLVIGCLAFIYFLLAWEKNCFVVHYGVPIVGHFFEKPEYDTKYRVELEPENSNSKLQAIADIHVEGRYETEDYGEENQFGQSITHSYSYRDVWVKKLYLPNGGTLIVRDQQEPLHLGESAFVKDLRGRSWCVRLLNEPIP